MNVIYMAKQTYSSIESLRYLLSLKEINIVGAVVREQDLQLFNICKANNITICNEKELNRKIRDEKIIVDYIISYYWKKISVETLSLCKAGINFHPGPLPEARGSGYHVAILESWGYWGVTVHYMDENYDTGDIIYCDRFEIPDNIVNKDLVQLAHEHLVKLFIKIVDMICNGEALMGKKQSLGKYYDMKEIENLKIINDSDNDDVVEKKIRAFWNPPYRGAQVKINEKYYTVINDEILDWISERWKDSDL